MNPGSRVVKTFCGICAGLCGLDVELDAAGEITDIRGDRNNPLTQGYACIKGLQLPAAHRSTERLLHPLKRLEDGTFVRIGLEQALDEIGARLTAILDRDGADAIGAFRGTLSYSNYMLPAWVQIALTKACKVSGAMRDSRVVSVLMRLRLLNIRTSALGVSRRVGLSPYRSKQNGAQKLR